MTEFVVIGEIVLVPGPQGVPGPNTIPTNEVIAAALVPYTKTADLATGPLAPYAKTADIPLTAAGYFGNLVVGDGDSITIAGTDSTFRIFADSWYTYVCAFSDGRMPYVFNAGHGGYSSADLVALLDTEVIAKVPRGGRVIWAAGRNDQQTLESTKAADRTVLEKCRKAGIDVVFTTLVPVGMTALDTPAAPVATYSNASGTLAAGTYGYKVVARNANGVTLPSTAASITTSAVGRVGLTWAHIQGATGYDIYRDDLKIGSSSVAAGRPIPAFTDTGLSGAGAPPSSNTTGRAPGNAADAIFTAKVNAWRKRFAAVSGCACIDFYRVLADPTTGYYRKGLTTDGVHPSPEAHRVMGTEAWATMSKVVPDVRGYVTEDQANPLNIYPNGLFLTGGGNPVDRPNGFGGTAAGTTTSLGTVAGFKGNAWSLERTTPAAITYNGDLFGGISLAAAGVNVGDLLQFAVRVQKTGSEVGGMVAEIEVAFTGGGARLGMWRLSADVADPTTLVSPPVAVPANTTALSVKVNTFGGTGKLTLGQLTIVDLTTAGLIV